MGAISLPCSTLWGWHGGVLGGGCWRPALGLRFRELYPSIGAGCCFTSRLWQSQGLSGSLQPRAGDVVVFSDPSAAPSLTLPGAGGAWLCCSQGHPRFKGPARGRAKCHFQVGFAKSGCPARRNPKFIRAEGVARALCWGRAAWAAPRGARQGLSCSPRRTGSGEGDVQRLWSPPELPHALAMFSSSVPCQEMAGGCFLLHCWLLAGALGEMSEQAG